MENQDINALVAGNNRFALDVYSKLWKAEGNVVFSPHNMSTACAIAYAGTRATTEEQIARTMHFNLGQARIHSAFASLETRLRTERGNRPSLHMANAMWFQGGYMPSEEFSALVANNYGAKISANIKEINDWIAKNTAGMIRNLIGNLNPQFPLVIVGAIYFLCQWEKQFARKNTRNGLFHVDASASTKVPMMAQRKRFRYAESDDLQILELPYAGFQQSMLIILPREIDGLVGLSDLLSLENLQKWQDRLEERDVVVIIPKLRAECRYELSSVLSSLGMVDAFSPDTADFSAISCQRPGLYIAQVVHEAIVRLDEAGTEASASTVIKMGLTGWMPHDEPVVFCADHPFVFFITDRPTGTILFMGKISNPSHRTAYSRINCSRTPSPLRRWPLRSWTGPLQRTSRP